MISLCTMAMWRSSRWIPSWCGLAPLNTTGCRPGQASPPWVPRGANRVPGSPALSHLPLLMPGGSPGAGPSTAQCPKRNVSPRRVRSAMVQLTFCEVHVVDATVIASVHRRVAADCVGGIPLHSSRLVNQVAVDFMQGALSHRGEQATEWAYVVRHSSHLASVILHRADQAAETADRPVHLRPPGTHVQFIQPQ